MNNLKFTPYTIWYLIKGCGERGYANHILMLSGFDELSAKQIVDHYYSTYQTHEAMLEFNKFVEPFLIETKQEEPKKARKVKIK